MCPYTNRKYSRIQCNEPQNTGNEGEQTTSTGKLSHREIELGRKGNKYLANGWVSKKGLFTYDLVSLMENTYEENNIRNE